MLRFCQEHKGSISILLLCVTFAMLIFSFVTLDISKANLASATARSNADIVGNAVLSDYDVMLKDAYGLFANSKSLDELSKSVTDYYLATMSSNGIEVKNTNEVYKAISGLINDASIAENNNLLQLKAGEVDLEGLSDKGSVVIQPVNESAISNPTVMRRQIVEYMKYRAPITLATGMLEKLNVLKDLNNQTTATTKKIEYEDALNDVQNSSDVVYHVMDSYLHNINDITTRSYPSGQPIEYIGRGMGNISSLTSGKNGATVVEGKYNYMIKALVGIAPLSDFINDGQLKKKDVAIVPMAPSSVLDLNNYLKTNQDYNDLKNLYNSSTSSQYMLMNTDDYLNSGSYSQEVFRILNNAKNLYNSSETQTGISDFYRNFYKMYYFMLENETTYSKDTNIDWSAYSEADKILSWAFGLPKVNAPFGYKYNYPSATDGSSTAVGGFANTLDYKVTAAITDFNTVATDVIGTTYYQMKMAEYMSGSNSPLNQLDKDIQNALKKSGEWSNSIDNVQTTSYQASMRDNFEIESANFKELDANSVAKMKQEFTTQYQYYKTLYSSFESKYNNVFKSTSVNLFKDTSGSNDPELNTPTYRFEILFQNYDQIKGWLPEIYLGNGFSATFNSYKSNSAVTDEISCANFSKNLTTGTNNDIYEIVKQISEKNIIANEDDKEKMKDEGNKAKENLNTRKAEIEKSQQDEEKEATKANNDDMSKVTGIPTFSAYIKENSTQDLNKDDDGVDEIKYNENKPKKDEEADGAKNLLSEVGSMFLDLAEAGRDNLYIAEYITGTFSCVTTAKNDGEDTTEDDPEESITGLALNPKNNKHYRAEVEYILYGFGTETGNKAAAIGTISAIRFALNLIYSFTDPEINTFTTSTASAIGALVPFSIPIIKTTLHILLSGAETAWDMLELTKGNSVPLYKNSATWVCKASNIAGNIAGQVVDIVVEPAVKAVTENLENKITEFVDGTASDVSSFATDMTTKTANDIKSMLKTKITTPVNDFITDILGEMESATDSITAEAESLVDTIIESLETSRESESEPGSVIYMAYGGMIDYLTTNKSYFAGQINGLAQKMMAEPTAYIHNFQKEFDNYMSGINAKIDSVVENLNDEINSFVSEAATEVKDLAVNTVNSASDQLLASVENGISSKLSGTRNQKINLGSGKDPAAATKGSALSNLLSMSYKDYLYVFLILGMINGTETELSRAAQLMQTNINHQAVEGGNYEINKGVTMFNVYTSAKVKTSVMGRFADSEGITLKNFSDGYYEIQIRSFAGY